MTTDKTPATLATAKHGGCVQLADSERARFEAFLRDNPFMALMAGTAWQVWQAALSAQPSPGGQGDALLESLVARWRNHAEEIGVSDNLLCQKIANCTMRHAAELQAVLAAQPSPGGQGDALDHARKLFDEMGTIADDEKCVAILADALAARQPVGEHGEGDEFLAGICVALQCVTAQDSGVLWAEIVRAVGVDDLLQYATFIEPEEWDLAGFSTYASIELGRRKPRSKASKQAKRPRAQAVDLAPASIPDTPEVRDILGRPNFWCSPWANVLRMRGDEIPNKAEEEQAAVIRFMLNHYLANGTAWAETAGAELDTIRKVDSQAVGNG